MSHKASEQSSFHAGYTCQQVANWKLAQLIRRTRGEDEPIDSSDIYATERLRAVEYLVEGNGPTTTITFIVRSSGDVDFAVLDYVEGSGRAQAITDGMVAAELYEAFKAAERPANG
jgi:hypothetical protein